MSSLEYNYSTVFRRMGGVFQNTPSKLETRVCCLCICIWKRFALLFCFSRLSEVQLQLWLSISLEHSLFYQLLFFRGDESVRENGNSNSPLSPRPPVTEQDAGSDSPCSWKLSSPSPLPLSYSYRRPSWAPSFWMHLSVSNKARTLL